MGNFVRNCRLCHEPIKNSPFTMCVTCLSESDKVRNYIGKNPQVTIKEISLSTNVPLEKVLRMVKLGLDNKKNVESNIR